MLILSKSFYKKSGEKNIFYTEKRIYYICFSYKMESAYKKLEASPSDSFEEIREKFIRKIIKIHPDKDELKSEEAKTLTEAWAYIKEHHNNNNNTRRQQLCLIRTNSEMKQFLKKFIKR